MTIHNYISNICNMKKFTTASGNLKQELKAQGPGQREWRSTATDKALLLWVKFATVPDLSSGKHRFDL